MLTSLLNVNMANCQLQVLGHWCSNSAPASAPSEAADFLSSGSSLKFTFRSAVGSYAGAAIKYSAHFDFFDMRPEGEG